MLQRLAVTAGGLALSASVAAAQAVPSRADWLRDARLGVFMHVLPASDADLAKLEAFDVDGLAAQVASTGARYFVLTLGQNSGYFNAPNAAYDRRTGYRPGERCAKRDLPRDLHRALQAKGLRLMLYLPCQAPNRDRRAQKAFGLAEGPKDQPIDARFARQWAEVIAEWSTRYGNAVSGWWFDGGYDGVGFREDIAAIYAEAARRGNPGSIVTFNPGVSLKRHTQAEDYTAGELNEPFAFVPTSRFVDGSQWHALTFVGSHWGARDTRFPAEQWREWVGKVVSGGGAVTLDVGPNWNEKAGPIGSIAEAQLAQLRAAGQSVAAGALAPADDALAAIERRVGGRLGVVAIDTGSGRRLEYRAGERFAMCSTFKLLLAAAVLQRVDAGRESLDRRVAYGPADLLEYAPVTRVRASEGGMTVADLARASVELSDNTAANLLLATLGGPEGLTRFTRSLGDTTTRLDRLEPMLNANEPGDPRDTTTPAAMAETARKLLLGDVLSTASRARLESWLVASPTGARRLRAGFPTDWRAGDKTGTGNNGATNDVAIAWPPGRAPIVVAAYLSESKAALADREAVLAEVGRLVTTPRITR